METIEQASTQEWNTQGETETCSGKGTGEKGKS